MQLTGSQALLEALVRADVKLIFGYPGGAIMPTYDALYDMSDQLRHILVRHEQGAAHAAVGYAKVSGKVGVCLVTSGPGATNLMTGIADAMMDSVPLVCITGQVTEHYLGTDAFQESDIVSMTISTTKWNYQVTSPTEIPEVIDKAFQVAKSGRPGPVLIDITKNAQVETFAYSKPSSKKRYQPKRCPVLNSKLVKHAAQLLNNAKRPIILAGHGVIISQAEEALLTLVEKANLPVASTLLGLSAFPSNHPLFKGMLGMHGHYAANILSNQADVVLAVGMRFDDRVTGDVSSYLKNAKVIHIDIDSSELNKNVKTDVAIHADANQALMALLPLVEPKRHKDWHQQFTEAYRKEYQIVIEASIHPTQGPIKMAEFIHLLSNKTQGQCVLVTDVGQHQMIAARYYHFKHTKSHITSGGLGSMGFSLPASIGVQIAVKNKMVISLSGDGGFQMNIQELGVVAQENLPIKMVILNNGYLGMVRQWQELFFEKRYAFTKMQNPDFVALAKSYGIPGKRVKHREVLSTAIDTLLMSKGAYLLEVCVEREENVFPIVPSGTSISKIRLK